MINKEELYELVIEDENIDGIFAISLVQDAAIESDFVYFDKEKVLFSSVDNEQRLVMGAILIPNKKILRIDGEGKTYHVFFKPETIKRLSEMYLKNKYTDKATLEHNQKINGVTLVESWIKESASKDKSALYNLNAPVGSWLGTFKIDNDTIWNDYVKTGDVKGFSIEGLFGHSLVSANEMFNLEKDISLFSEVEAEILLEKIKDILQLEEGVAHYTADGKLYEGPTHKDASGRLMTGEVHTEDSEYLYHIEELEAQPSVSSTYPGQAASGSIAPALLK
jgi:hypothetical protein